MHRHDAGKRPHSNELMYIATPLISSSVSRDAIECMIALSLVRSRLLKERSCSSM